MTMKKTKTTATALVTEMESVILRKNKPKPQPARQEHEYDAIIDRRAEVFSEMVRAAMIFATDVQKEKLGQFEDKVQHNLETQEQFDSLELALLSELQILEKAIIELRKMVTFNV